MAREADEERWDRDTLIRFFQEGIPFNKLLGMRVRSLDTGRCVIEVPIHDQLVGDPTRPALHGGVLSALADAAGGLAVFSALPRGDTTSTVDLRIDYLRPAKVEGELLAEAALMRLGNRVAAADCIVHQGDREHPVAVCRAVYNVVRHNPFRRG